MANQVTATAPRTSVLGVDLHGLYQPYVDFPTLRANGVSFSVVKAWDGNWTPPATEKAIQAYIDRYQIKKYVDEARAFGMVSRIYGWLAPFNSLAQNTDFLLEVAHRVKPDGIDCDSEQRGTTWHNKPPYYDKDKMVTKTADYMRIIASFGKPVRLYMSTGFVQTAYGPAFKAALGNYKKWWAQYFKSRSEGEFISLGWNELKENYIKKINLSPALSATTGYDWAEWQWIGVLFLLPGIYENAAMTIRASVDLNFSSQTEAELFAEYGLTAPIPQPEEPPVIIPEYPVWQNIAIGAWEQPGNLRVRNAPSTLTGKELFTIPSGSTGLPIFKIVNGDNPGDQWAVIGYKSYTAIKVNGFNYLTVK